MATVGLRTMPIPTPVAKRVTVRIVDLLGRWKTGTSWVSGPICMRPTSMRLRRQSCSSSACHRRVRVPHPRPSFSTGAAPEAVAGATRGRSGPMAARVALCARAPWSTATHRAAGWSDSRCTRGVCFEGRPVASPCLPLGVGISPGQFGSTRSMLCTLYWRR